MSSLQIIETYKQVATVIAKQTLDDVEAPSAAANKVISLQDEIKILEVKEKSLKERLAKYETKRVTISEPVKNLNNEKVSL